MPQWIVSIEQGRAPLPLDPSTLLRVSGPPGEGFARLGTRQRRTCNIFDRLGGRNDGEGVGLGLGHLGDAEVAGADLDAVYDPADLVVAELLEAKAV